MLTEIYDPLEDTTRILEHGGGTTDNSESDSSELDAVDVSGRCGRSGGSGG